MNTGDQPVEMTGWNLQSDPPDKESLPLASLGFLSPGETIHVESGPTAEAAFVWSADFVFRDADPTDYARLASDAGAVLLQVNCGQAEPPPSSSTPSSTLVRRGHFFRSLSLEPGPPSPTPSPTPAALGAVSGVPSGGGPPPATVGPSFSWALVTALGGSMMVAGVVVLALSRIRELLTPWKRQKAIVPSNPLPASEVASSQRTTAPGIRSIALAVILLASLILLFIVLQIGERRKGIGQQSDRWT